MSAACSAAGWDAVFSVVTEDRSAVRNEGSNSRVLSSVRGTFSDKRCWDIDEANKWAEREIDILSLLQDRSPLAWLVQAVFAA